MKFSIAIALFLALIAVAQALPSRTARQEEAAADPAAAAPADAEPVAAEAALSEAEKGHVEHHPEVHPHPINWHVIYNAFKAVAPVVGGLIEPLLVNIAHGVVGAVIETINTGFSIPVPHHYPAHHHGHVPESHGPHHHE